GGVLFFSDRSASTPRRPASKTSPPVTISSASQVEVAFAIPAAPAPIPKPRAKSRSTAATSPKAIPRANEAILRLSSRLASSSSRRTSALACSATFLAAGPSPCSVACSVSWVCMASPVDHLGGEDAHGERGSDDEQRRRATARLLASLLARRLRGRRGRDLRRGLPVRPRGVSACPGRDQARLQLAQEGRVLGELARQPLADAVAACGCASRELLQPRRAPLDE